MIPFLDKELNGEICNLLENWNNIHEITYKQ